ncbi:MAG TPA: isoprenylcysteine carboxylmethyltransferase family protein [Anaerolineales bacterium]|nr:isoprenylcysteine carboxylmethyltransferase family protein [Anaerolineales bacterium]
MKLRWIDIVVYLIIYLVLFALAIVAGLHNTLSYVALGLSLACVVLWFVARWQLGDAFSVTPQARQLVTRGLYSKIRHPIYVFGTLAFLFIVLALQGWPALIIWAVVILIQLMRVRREERVLAEKFGTEYTTYRSKTWF